MKARNKRISATITAFALSAVMLFSTAAIAGAETASESTSASSAEEQTIAGSYEAEYDMHDLLKQQMEGSGIELEGEIPVVFTMDLKEDDTFVLEMDVEAFMETIKNIFTEQGPNIIRTMMEQQGITEETFSDLAEQLGAGSYDEFVQGLTDQMTEQLSDSLAESMATEVSVAGTYSVDGEEITLIGETVKVPGADAEASSESAASSSEEVAEASSEETTASSAEETKMEELKGKIAEDGSIELEFPMDEENTMKLVFQKQ